MKTFRVLILFLFGTFFYTCVEPIGVNIKTTTGYLLVDGTITDLNQPQIISIFRTLPNVNFQSTSYSNIYTVSNQSIASPVTKASVQLVIDGSNILYFNETDPGYYQLPTGFVGKVGSSYQLKFQTQEGEKYESAIEIMPHVPPIKNISEKFNPVGVAVQGAPKDLTPTSDFYADFDDTANEKNFYRWRWTDYETQNICASCVQGQYFLFQDANGNITGGDCVVNSSLRATEVFDYPCQDACWDVFNDTEINIFSDVYTDGKPQLGKLIAQVPLYQANHSLVSLKQMSLTAAAYRYYKLIQDQSTATGSLADTPAATIKSNVLNTANSLELVLGYFTASSVSEVRYLLDREDTQGSVFNGLFAFFHHRDLFFEPRTAARLFIPLALCKQSQTRTPNKPAGWQ